MRNCRAEKGSSFFASFSKSGREMYVADFDKVETLSACPKTVVTPF